MAAGSGAYRATRVGPEAYAVQLAEEARRFTLTHSELRAGDRHDPHGGHVRDRADGRAAVHQPAAQPRRRCADALSASVAGTVAMVPEGLVLLTSLAFAVGVLRLAKRRVLVQELPGRRGPRPHRRAVHRQDGHAHRGAPGRGGRGGPRRRRCRTRPRSPRWRPPTRIRTPRWLRSGSGSPTAPNGWAAGEVVPFSSARKWSARVVRTGGHVGAGRPRRPAGRRSRRRSAIERRRPRRRAAASCCWPGPTAGLAGEELPAGLRPAALVVLGDRPRPDAAETLRVLRRAGRDGEGHLRRPSADGGRDRRAAGAAGRGDPVDARAP